MNKATYDYEEVVSSIQNLLGVPGEKPGIITIPKIQNALKHANTDYRINDSYKKLYDGSISRQIALKKHNQVILAVEGAKISPRDILKRHPAFWTDILN